MPFEDLLREEKLENDRKAGEVPLDIQEMIQMDRVNKDSPEADTSKPTEAEGGRLQRHQS